MHNCIGAITFLQPLNGSQMAHLLTPVVLRQPFSQLKHCMFCIISIFVMDCTNKTTGHAVVFSCTFCAQHHSLQTLQQFLFPKKVWSIFPFGPGNCVSSCWLNPYRCAPTSCSSPSRPFCLDLEHDVLCHFWQPTKEQFPHECSSLSHSH